jgi:Protein of unknown function (DUF2695)
MVFAAQTLHSLPVEGRKTRRCQMDQNSVISLGKYLNYYIDPKETCDRTLQKTIAWLKANHYDVDAELIWLRNRGIQCDCEVVISLYLPNRVLSQLTME